ncbi:MAG: hypothetical protein L0H73_15920 [Nitrococcus sp.]|nr:hypothetical protein [Nitrococcus sp.]
MHHAGWFAIGALMLLVACASTSPAPVRIPESAKPHVAQCARLFEKVERMVAAHDVRDNQAELIEGFPYLRVNRFLASFADEVQGEALNQWLQRLARLDTRARSHELANLPTAAGTAPRADIQERLARCRQALQHWDLSHPARIGLIRKRAQFPDGYLTWRRLAGLYPVSAWFILLGVEDWQQDVKAKYAGPPPVYEQAVVYAPPWNTELKARQVAAILRDSAQNLLEIPLPDQSQRRVLARAFAPVITLPVTGPFDRIGRPVWTKKGLPTVKPEPVVYILFSHTRLGKASLLQINYLVWFAARPNRGTFDLLSGRLDGLLWRVTLGRDGKPLLYDSMHPCGCYHMAFPGPRLEPKPPPTGLQEPLLVPRPAPAGSHRMSLYLEPRTHYLVGLSRVMPDGRHVTYRFQPYDTLRSMPRPAGGHRSLFGAFGIVRGSERPERFFLWPTGVRSPGAMRQWGRHVTAFVGMRHFDDPYLIERYFDIQSNPRL